MAVPLELAASILRSWTWLYTSGLDPDCRDARRAEIESDLWDFRDDVEAGGGSELAAAGHVLARLVMGIPDDVLWRREHAVVMTPATIGATGVLRTPVGVRRMSGFGLSALCHGAVMAAVVWLAPRAVELTRQVKLTARQPIVVYVPAAKVFAPPPDVAGTYRPAADSVPDDLGIALDRSSKASTTIAMPNFTFDFSRVVDRAGALFPFLTGTAALDALAQAGDPQSPTRTTMPPAAGASADAGAARTLTLSPEAMQAMIDRTWSRRERWSAFQPIAELVEQYDGNGGQLADLVQGYIAQNGLQPYSETGVRDPRLWTQLGVAADHAAFIEFITRIVLLNPSTRTATELLFLLDTIVQGSFDTLSALLDVVPDEDLGWTRWANEPAYDAVVTIQRHYREELLRRNIASRASLRAYFDEARLSILNRVVRTTPQWYRLADAQFLIGQIYWKQGRLGEAVAVWTSMRPVPGDRYQVVATEVGGIVRGGNGAVDGLAINRALDAERARWVDFSHDRLLRFGFRFNTF